MEFVEHLLAHYPPEEVDLLLKAIEEGEEVHGLLLNHRRFGDADLLKKYPSLKPHPFIPHAYLYDKKELDLGKSFLFDVGAFYIMDPSSMAVAHFLDPKPGMKVLDLCAAPGGKTVHASLLMEQEGAILANDLSFPRAKELSSNVERMGLANVAVTSSDIAARKDNYRESFDAIILDAPCSGSATFRKNAAAKEDWTYAKVMRCQQIQIDLIKACFAMLKPGGKLLYSTCSFSYEEDEGVVLSLTGEEIDASLLPLDCPGAYHHTDLKEAIHLFPSHYQGEGQFLALIQKKGTLSETVYKGHVASAKAKATVYPYAEENGDYLEKEGVLYRLPLPLDIRGLSCLRYGIKIGELKSPFIPDFALARANLGTPCIDLNEEEAKAYLRGETFACQKEKGFALVRYFGLPLGFVKVSGNQAKNHYPKGLRHSYQNL